MTDQSLPNVQIRNIAIATDFCPWSGRATRHALLVARQLGAAVHFLHAISRSEFTLVPDLMVELDVLAERDCEEMIRRLRAVKELDSIETYCWNIDGEASEVCGDLIRNHRIDLLVIGTRGRSGISKFLSGSIAQEICQHISCPVLTVGPRSRGATKQLDLKRVLFVTDLSNDSRAAIPYVLTAARTWNAEVDVLYVCSSGNRDWLPLIENFGRTIKDVATPETSASIRYHAIAGKLAHSVLDFARRNKEDVIVLGLDRNRSIYGSHDSSDAYEIICQATCPVLSVHSAAASATGDCN